MDHVPEEAVGPAERKAPARGIWPRQAVMNAPGIPPEAFAPGGFESLFSDHHLHSRRRRVAVVGATGGARRLLQKLRFCQPAPAVLTGVYDDHPAEPDCQLRGVGPVKPVEALVAQARRRAVDLIVLAFPPSRPDQIRSALARLDALPAEIAVIDEGNGHPAPPGRRVFLAGEHLRVLVEPPVPRAGALLKRAMDIVLALSVLAFCAPLLLLIALLVFLESPGGVLFRQPRAGFNNQPFTLLKFRTTVADAPDREAGNPRPTRLGRLLRRCGLDELPQLLNVLGGSMSVVGPRPRAAAAPCSPRHRMKPGLTGWAQVNEAGGGIHGPEEASRAAALDLEYARRWSIWLDIRIVLRTIGMVLSGRGAP